MKAMHRTWAEDVAAIAARDLPWQRLSGQRVLVTGAAGFLGGYLVRTLLSLHAHGKVEQPVHVIAMVRDAARSAQRFADLAGRPDLELCEWDLNRIAVPDIRGASTVLHAASQASPRFYGSDPVGTLLPNTIGTAGLLQALQQAPDPRGLLFISSSEVYGTVTGDASLGESRLGSLDPTQVRACYAESKRLGETLCVAWHHQYRVPTFIVRPFHTYGPGLQPDDGRVFADFAFNVLRGENIVMTSDGSARRAFCYVTDAVAGFFGVLLKGAPGQAYNVGNPAAELSVMELAELLTGLYPDLGLSVERRAGRRESAYLASGVSRQLPDVARLRELGWHADVDAASGFRRMIEAYRI